MRDIFIKKKRILIHGNLFVLGLLILYCGFDEQCEVPSLRVRSFDMVLRFMANKTIQGSVKR